MSPLAPLRPRSRGFHLLDNNNTRLKMESQAQDTEVDKQTESNSDEMVIDRQSIDTTATATQPPQESTPTPSTSEPATVLPRSNPTTNSNSSSSSLQNVRVIKPPRTDGPCELTCQIDVRDSIRQMSNEDEDEVAQFHRANQLQLSS